MKKEKLQIRITTGSAKNKKLKVPVIPGFRSVQEVAKMSLFSIIGDRINNASCLDLYAGSGNMGIEALSRGAGWCDLVDQDFGSVRVIRENLKDCGFNDRAEVFHSDSIKYAANTQNKYDIIFVDPFYTDTAHIFLVKNLEDILKENGLIAFFHGDNLDINTIIKNTGLVIADERRFGKSIFTLLVSGN